MAQKVTHKVFGPPSIEDRFYDAYAAWCWGQKEYALCLMNYLIEDEVDEEQRHKKGNNGKAFTEAEEASSPGYVEDGDKYAWNGWRFNGE